MEIGPCKRDHYFDQCDPVIKNSLSPEQSREVKRLLGLSLECPNQGESKFSFNIWFLRLYFVTLYFRKERRPTWKRIKESNKFEIFFSIISILFSFVCTLSIIVAIFLSLYYIKSAAGIDLFEKWHLKDLFKWYDH